MKKIKKITKQEKFITNLSLSGYKYMYVHIYK